MGRLAALEGAHPRSRGEHWCEFQRARLLGGSSPLARGTLIGDYVYSTISGLIPARAGNTFSRRFSVSLTGGSSPLARGTPNPTGNAASKSGLIPARAGNTRLIHSMASNARAHPRSRGEHGLLVFNALVAWGSSPLARGTQKRHDKSTHPPGLIPARAGNTVWRALPGSWHGAHPRSRGEHLARYPRRRALWGSSPLARGTLPDATKSELSPGLIPARAGNTFRPHSSERRGGAHPRSRGEHLSKDRHRAIAAGSSPLARGTHPAWSR